MKGLILFSLLLICGTSSFAQRRVAIKTLWARPQVHVLFEGYTLSFTIKDIDKALSLLAETGDTAYGDASGLDTAGNYPVELLPGTKTEYRNRLQPLMQNAVGVFLLSKGHASIQNKKHKTLSVITMNVLPVLGETTTTYVIFTDPHTGAQIFTGKVNVAMFNKDLGIE